MNLKCKISNILCSVLLCCFILSSCSSDGAENKKYVAMVKNADMSTYGTGFAVGIPGEAVDTVVTSYSVIATRNGAAPKSAEITVNESEKKIRAKVMFFDAVRNIAVLRLGESTEKLKPLLLEKSVNSNDTVYVDGYDGTGNIMSDFESFNTTNIIRYKGNISAGSEFENISVYKFSNEFNRALAGAPATDENGDLVGMCAYSQNGMDTYAQYVLSSNELAVLFAAHDVEFMTTEEAMCKKIILLSVILGIVLLAAIVIVSAVAVIKKESNPKNGDVYIKITGGVLNGRIYKLEDKLAIGRNSAVCDVVYPINEPGVGALHCTVKAVGKDVYLTDNFSKYGTFLENGARISPSNPYKIEGVKVAFYIAEPKNRLEIVVS